MSSSKWDSILEKVNRFETLLDAPRFHSHEKPFVTMWRPGAAPEFETLRLGQFLSLSRSYAALYRRHEVVPGNIVALIMDQGVELMAGFVGAMLAGAVPTILAYPNFKVDPEKYCGGLAGVSANIGAGLTVLDEGFPPEFREPIERNPDARVVQIRRSDLSEDRVLTADHRPVPGEVAFVQHSAGTTGLQKGVALSHRVVLNQLRQLIAALRISERDRIASWLPLYHDMGLIACFMLPFVAGIEVVMQSPVDWVMKPGSFLRLISSHRCTLGWVPNFAFQFMSRRILPEERKKLDLSPLRALITTSEPIRAGSMDEFRETFAPQGLPERALQTSYGMAESTFAVTSSDPDTLPARLWVNQDLLSRKGRIKVLGVEHPSAICLVSCGRPLPGAVVKIVDEKGAELPGGRVGEILVRSSWMFEGYLNRPDLTREALRKGWYWSGDMGFLMDSEVFVLGRKDDTIIVGGRNFYPQDIEEIAFQHSAIRDGRAAAFGLYNPDLGTEDLVVVAEVSDVADLERKSGIALEIRQDVLAAVGVTPRFVSVVAPKWLVKSTAGKPARSANRKKFLSEHPDLKAGEAWERQG